MGGFDWLDRLWRHGMAVLVFLLVAVPMAVTLGAVHTVAEPMACAACHTGQPAAQAKAKEAVLAAGRAASPPALAQVREGSGPHGGVPCRACHGDLRVIQRGLSEGVKPLAAPAPAEGATPAGEAGRAAPAAGEGVAREQPGADVADAACARCHEAVVKERRPPADYRSEHALHAARGVRCVTCHEAVGHGRLKADGKGVDFPKPQEKTCMDCHKPLTPVGTWPPTLVRCPTCHNNTSGQKPGFHDEGWVKLPTNHGPTALAKGDFASMGGVGLCAGCHGKQRIDDGLAAKDTSDARLFARNNYWCSGCHLNNRPPRHSDIWRVIHRTQAISFGESCMICHNADKPDMRKWQDDLEQRAVPTIWCNRCHSPDTGYKHPPAKDWLPVHYQFVKSKGPIEGRCFYCHSVNHCLTCHNSVTAKVLMEKYRAQWRKEGKEPPPPPTGLFLGVPQEFDRRF